MTIVRNNSKSKSGLFLLELIIAIVFFAISSAICIQLFVKAHTLSIKSADLNMAVIQAQNAAEAFKAAGGDPQKLSELLDAVVDGDSITISYYKDWTRAGTSSMSATYWLLIKLQPGENLNSARIFVQRRANPDENAQFVTIYEIETKCYTGSGAKS